jgi:hypothetical protein
MSSSKQKVAVTRSYLPSPESCTQALRLLLEKPEIRKATRKHYPRDARRLTP